MSQENKSLSRNFIEAFNDGDFGRVDGLTTEDFAYHGPGQELTGREAAKNLMRMYRGAFPDAKITILDQIAEGDKVVNRCRAEGTNDGDLGDISATGKAVSLNLQAIHRIVDGRIAEEWEVFEELQMLQQMGIGPT